MRPCQSIPAQEVPPPTCWSHVWWTHANWHAWPCPCLRTRMFCTRVFTGPSPRGAGAGRTRGAGAAGWTRRAGGGTRVVTGKHACARRGRVGVTRGSREGRGELDRKWGAGQEGGTGSQVCVSVSDGKSRASWENTRVVGARSRVCCREGWGGRDGEWGAGQEVTRVTGSLTRVHNKKSRTSCENTRVTCHMSRAPPKPHTHRHFQGIFLEFFFVSRVPGVDVGDDVSGGVASAGRVTSPRSDHAPDEGAKRGGTVWVTCADRRPGLDIFKKFFLIF